MKKIILFLLFVSQSILLIQAQIIKDGKPIIRCGSTEYNNTLLNQYPEMMGSPAFEYKIQKVLELKRAQRSAQLKETTAIITIPVVVHVLHNGEPIGVGPNISEAQVLSQITVLNQDFRKIASTRGDGGGVDTEIQFQLAKQDPDGCPTNGIDRVNIGQDGINESSQADAQNQMNALKPASIWDSSSYLNIWTIKYTGGEGLLGYAQLPGGGANTDGVVVDYHYFGSDDDPNVTLAGSYNLGRTTTHEVGHYLGLLHTWGDEWSDGDSDDASCGADDGIDDTPNSGKPNLGCPSIIPDTCPTDPDDDMIENYMDYSDDICFDTFTQGQKERMQAVLASSRANLAGSTKSNLLSGVNNDVGVHIVSLQNEGCSLNMTPVIKIINWGDQLLTATTLSYNIDGGTTVTYNWSGNLAKGIEQEVTLPALMSTSGSHTFTLNVDDANGTLDDRPCNNTTSSNFIIQDEFATATKVILNLQLDNYAEETTWEFRGSDNTLLYNGSYDNTNNGDLVTQEFDVSSNECYTFTIFDASNDGICCNYGIGSYELKTDTNVLIASGGEFTDSEVVNISTKSLSVTSFFAGDNIRIYPNPTSNNLNISLAIANDLPDGYEIYNTLGQLVKRAFIKETSDLSINTSKLKSGMYFIRIEKEGYFVAYPFVKN